MTPQERVAQIREKIKADPFRYSSLNDWIADICKEYHKQLLPSPGDLGGLLFSIHKHIGEYAVLDGEMEEHVTNPDLIVYEEKDIVELLKKLGFPEPVWGKVIPMSGWIPEVTDTLEEDEGGLG